MLILQHSTSTTFKKLNSHLFKRNVYIRSRFQNTSSIPPNQILIPKSPLIDPSLSSTQNTQIPKNDHPDIKSIGTLPLKSPDMAYFKSKSSIITAQHDESTTLQHNILSKINSLKLDKFSEGNKDFYLITQKSITKPHLSQIDEYILQMAKKLAPSAYHNFNEYSTLNNSYYSKYKIINNKIYTYKYDLLNNNSIIESDLLTELVGRLTNYNYLNSNDKIKHFFKSRLIFSDEGQIILKNNRQIANDIIKFFLKNINFFNTGILKNIIEIIGGWDTTSLNILLKYSLNSYTDSQMELKLKLIDETLNTFYKSGLNINVTTIYLIYSNIHIADSKKFESKVLKYGLQDYCILKKLVNNETFTAFLFQDLQNSFNLINSIQNNMKLVDTKNILIEDSIRSMNLIPKLDNITKSKFNENNYSIKMLKHVFNDTKYRNKGSLQSLIKCHLDSTNWKTAWKIAFGFDSYSRFIQPVYKSKLDHNRHLQNSLGYQLTANLVSLSNWQLFIRTINELHYLNPNSRLTWNIYYKSLKHLLDVQLKNTHLDSLSFLISLKYLLNKSLDSDLGPFKQWNILFKSLQHKVDSIYNTNYANSNFYIWLEKLRLVRTNRIDASNFQLFSSFFETTECYEVIEEGTIEKNENEARSKQLCSTSKGLSVSSLISPDLSILTPFESQIMKDLSQLRVLDSKEKVLAEYSNYQPFYDSKGIVLDEVYAEYHLGFVNKSYKPNSMKWVKLDHGLDVSDVDFNTNEQDKVKLEAFTKINEIVHDNLTNLLNKSDDYIAMEKIFTLKNPDGKFVKINPKSSMNNLLPNDWLYMVINKCHNDWIVDQITHSSKCSLNHQKNI